MITEVSPLLDTDISSTSRCSYPFLERQYPKLRMEFDCLDSSLYITLTRIVTSDKYPNLFVLLSTQVSNSDTSTEKTVSAPIIPDLVQPRASRSAMSFFSKTVCFAN